MIRAEEAGKSHEFHAALATSARQADTLGRRIPPAALPHVIGSNDISLLREEIYAAVHDAFERYGLLRPAVHIYEAFRHALGQTPRLDAKLACLYGLTQRAEHACALYEEALLQKWAQFPRVVAMTRYAVLLSRREGRSSRVTSLLAEAELLCHEIPDRNEALHAAARVSNAAAFVAYRDHDFKSAFRSLRLGDRLLSRIDQRPQLSKYRFTIEKNRARLLSLTGANIPARIASCRRMIDIATRDDDVLQRNSALLFLAWTYVSAADVAAADRCFTEILTTRSNALRPSAESLHRHASGVYLEHGYNHYARQWQNASELRVE